MHGKAMQAERGQRAITFFFSGRRDPLAATNYLVGHNPEFKETHTIPQPRFHRSLHDDGGSH